jgi:hypothetical protein
MKGQAPEVPVEVMHLDGVDWLPAVHKREGPSKSFGVAL